jgi:threonine/homoserine/homoserine lactone efflux protein
VDLAALLPLIGNGLLLGWSVAWPPGPINAEMIRRGLAGRHGAALALGLGACSGDFLWALAVALGAGVLVALPGVRTLLGGLSLALLLLLAWSFLRGAARAWSAWRRGEELPAARRLEGAGGGYLLGLTLALSSPWNVAFWTAVIGQQASAAAGLAASLTLASAVVAGAAAWCFVLNGSVRLGARFATPAWDIATRAATGALMLAFAARLALRLANG